MMSYILDVCAMIAVLANEPGTDAVDAVYDKAAAGEAELSMNVVNLLEVYYDLVRSDEVYIVDIAHTEHIWWLQLT